MPGPVAELISVPEFAMDDFVPIAAGAEEVRNGGLQTFEEMDMGWGQMIYMAGLPETEGPGVLTLDGCHDFARVFIDGKLIGTVDRVKNETSVSVPELEAGSELAVLVEGMGRINFGRAIKDFKGITGQVTIETGSATGEKRLYNIEQWTNISIPDEYGRARKVFRTGRKVSEYEKRLTGDIGTAGYYRGYFDPGRPGDTFLDMSSWGKGQLYVNGHAIGRFWKIGPQQTLYMPGCWLREGENEIIVLDLKGPAEMKVPGLKRPILDMLRVKAPETHRKDGQNLKLAGETPVHSGTFAKGNGWQEVKFKAPAEGRYLCLDATSNYDGTNIAAIAELDVLDENGRPLPREDWKVVYADSEETRSGNRTADKVYDRQESTFWQTVDNTAFPHQLIIDLGGQHKVTGLRMLPRAEAGAPGLIKDYKVYVKASDFTY